MRTRTRTALLMVVMVSCISAAIGATFGLGDNTPETTPGPSRAEVYSEGMTLEEIGRAASGAPGELVPPCPEAKVVDALKGAGIAFGPCDPTPEDGAPVRLPQEDQAIEPPADASEAVCPGTILGKGVDLSIQLPCAVGAEIVDAAAVPKGDGFCAEVTYVEKAGAEARTETLCEGDVAAIGGEPVKGPRAASTDEHGEQDEDGHDHEHQ